MDNNKSNSSVKFIADGGCREYNFTFEIFNNSNIEVYIADILQDSGFLVIKEKNSTGGRIVFDTAPASGMVITILRSLPIKRMTDFKEGGPFRASKVNYEFDYQLACLEQLLEKLSRTVCKPPYFSDDTNMTLPIPNKGKAIVWNSEENALKNSDISIDDFYGAYIEAQKLYNDSKNALDNMEIQVEKVEACAALVDSIFANLSIVMSGLDSKSNIDFQNTLMSDYVIEEWSENNGASWYKIYKSGLIEQGGNINSTINFNQQFPLLKPFSSNKYAIFISPTSDTNATPRALPVSESVFTASVKTSSNQLIANNCNWFSRGK